MLASHFVRRGYPRPLIKKALYRADKQDRDSLLEGRHGDIVNSPTGSTHDSNIETSPAGTFYCITTHNPRNPPLRGIITNNWELLLKSKTTRILENAKIVFGSRRNKNLSDFLVRASTRTGPEHLRNIIDHYRSMGTLTNHHATDLIPVGTARNEMLPEP